MVGIASSTVMLGTIVGEILVGFVSDKNLNMGLIFGVIPALIAVPVLVLINADRNSMILGMFSFKTYICYS